MKMNKKIIVSTLALAMGAALAGSVSGTVAWFQYSTRAQATYIGASAHCSEMLEISADGTTYATELSKLQPAANTGDKLEPITTGALDANAALPTKDDSSLKFYKNPVYQYANPEVWGLADAHNYVQFDLKFRVRDINSPEAMLANHNLFLTNVEIVSLADSSGASTDTTSNAKDLYKAVRVHLSATNYEATFAAGETDDVTTVTHGKLDLNNDGAIDKTTGYEWTSDRKDVDYGNPTNAEIANPDTIVQKAYSTGKSANFANDSDPSKVAETTAAPGKIGAIDQTNGISVKVTIWIEGWQQLDKMATPTGTDAANDKQVWDPATYIGKNFGVGLRFATELHTAH